MLEALGPVPGCFRHGRACPGHPCLAVSVKGVDARDKPGHDEGNKAHPASAAFTRPLALPKSICPAYFARSTAITLPMSFMPAAPVSATAAEIAALTSSSDICFGR